MRSSPTGEAPAPRRRRPHPVVLLRRIDADTPIHRLWAGTKLLAVAAASFTLCYNASWAAIALAAAMVLAGARLARVPGSAVPRPPVWLWTVVALGGMLTVFAGGRPELAVASVHVGLGDLVSYVRFLGVAVDLLGAAALIGWTTALGDIGPATASLLRPLRWLRLPVDEWAITLALCIRALPLLVGEVRVLLAVRRLRPRVRGRSRVESLVEDAIEILVAALTVSLRRAAEMAEAITARGGPTGVTARVPGPRRADLVVGVVAAGVCVVPWFLPT